VDADRSKLESEFDRFADEYYEQLKSRITLSGEKPEYFAEYKIVDIGRELARQGQLRPGLSVLDFGAGTGSSIPWVGRHLPGAHLTCLDPSRRSLEVAERRFPGQARLMYFDGRRIPLADGSFDVAYAMCVFHHIDRIHHVALMSELRRVLKEGAQLFIFEHNPWNPLTRRVVNDCRFDENAVLIRASELESELFAAGFAAAAIRYRIFFPGFARALRPLERWMTWLPLGGQYYVRATR